MVSSCHVILTSQCNAWADILPSMLGRMLTVFVKLLMPMESSQVFLMTKRMPVYTLDYAMTYFYRIRGMFSNLYTNYDLFVACLIVADKYTNDYNVKNRAYSQAFRIKLRYLNYLEGWILMLMNYRLSVSDYEIGCMRKTIGACVPQTDLEKDVRIKIQ